MDCIAALVAAYGPHAHDDRRDPVMPRESVKAALAAGDITRQTAALLAILGPRAQDTAVDRIVNVRRPSEPELRRAIELCAKPLEDACFDGNDCAECRYNSDVQATQGYDVVAAGLCLNKICYEAKEAQELERRASPLRERYRVIRLVVDPRSGPPQWRQVRADGDDGVGATQHAQCLGQCPRYGAVIEGGSFRTTTRTDVCTDPVCHSEKVQAALDQAQAQKREFVWRHALRRHLSRASVAQRGAMYLAALDLGAGVDSEWKSRYGHNGSESTLAYLARHDNAAAAKEATHQAQLSLIRNVPSEHLARVLRACDICVGDHWCLTAGFLEVFSLAQLREVAQDLGLVAQLPEQIETQGRLAYAKALGNLLAGVKVLGYVPRMLRP